MKFAGICAALAVVIGSFSSMPQAAPQPKQSEIASADRLFQAGKFAEAGKIYAQIAAQDPKDYPAILRLGRIALLSNRLDDAQKWLERALPSQPADADAKVMLAEAFYRRDDFQKAAAALNGVDVSSNKLIISQYPTLNIAKLESFKGQTPYEVQGDGTSTRLKFLQNRSAAAGQRARQRRRRGHLLHRYRRFGGRARHGIRQGARHSAIRGGARHLFRRPARRGAAMGGSRSLAIGDWTVKNLPAAMLPLRQLSQGLGGQAHRRIIGTTLLYHFLATMDFPHGELVLRRKTAKSLEQLTATSSGKRTAVPFWIAGDHFMVGWGRVDALPPALLFVDTGIAGAGIKLAQSVIKQAGIKLEEDKASEGVGGGGKLKIVPYTVSRVSFGDIHEDNVPGLYDGPFPWEHSFGFYLAGMVGHDFFMPYAVTFDFRNMRIFLQ